MLEKCDKTSLISAPILRMDKNKKSYINQLKGIIPTANILNYNSPKKFMDFNPEDSIPQLSPSKVNNPKP